MTLEEVKERLRQKGFCEIAPPYNLATYEGKACKCYFLVKDISYNKISDDAESIVTAVLTVTAAIFFNDRNSVEHIEITRKVLEGIDEVIKADYDKAENFQ